MKKLIIAVLVTTFLWSCGEKKEGVITISGKVEEAIPQGEVILEKYEMGQINTFATTYSDHNGNFELEAAIEGPGFYRINVYGKQFETIILDKDNLQVEASGQPGDALKVTGSQEMKNLKTLYAHLRETDSLNWIINQKYSIAVQQPDNEEIIETLTSEALVLQAERMKGLKKMAWELEGSLVSLLVTDYIPNKQDEFAFLDSLSNKLTKEIPNSKDVQLFTQNLESFRPTVRIGDIAPEISLEKPNGEIANLSDLKGKYVLLDFWAAWCGPCRRENPNVVKLYNRYKDDGFEVFSVSLDRKRDQWLAAIEKDGLVWENHVSDLKYFQSAAAIRYKVNAIPFALLLDPEGRVIGKNLRGIILQNKLESIFGEM